MQLDIVCLSHLGWDWVWQRPQHIMTRLAQRHRILWCEEPRIEIGAPGETFEITEERPNIQIGRLIYRSDAATFRARMREMLERSGAQDLGVPEHIREASLLFDSPAQPTLEREVSQFVQGWRRNPLVLWLYTPMVIDFIGLLQPDLVVYDVMDELAAFQYAPARLREREQELLRRANLIFTGGPSLYAARRAARPDAHLFPSGVEQRHFAQALSPQLPVPAGLAELRRPVVGFFGVIDERIDLELLAEAARLRPEWSWAMVGPVIKIDQRALPRLPNIHYFGKQPYADLPAYLKGFDVAMLPFARNAATRFISPTKTLEYMAGHKPIVSTPIRDVIDLYGAVVRVAEHPQQLVDAVQAALDEQPSQRAARAVDETVLLRRYAWDTLVGEMQRLILSQIERSAVA